MDITVLMGSPNQNGSTHLLVESFKRGAEEAGHRVHVIDAAHAQVHPCTGCLACGYEGPCVQKDGMPQLKQQILGEGHSPVGRKRPVTPWGKSAFGTRTRKVKKASSKLILKRRTK